MSRCSRFLVALIITLSWTGCSHEKAVSKQPESQVASRSPGPSRPPITRAPAAPPTSAEGENAIYFDFDVSLLRNEALPLLQRIAGTLKSNSSAKVRIEGNCDARGTSEYNLALGAQRAQAARRYLESLGVQPSRIETVSYGSERPRFEGRDESTWAKNRRDDLVVR